MNQTVKRVAVALPRKGAGKWQEIMLDSLGERATAVEWDGPAPPEVPMPWRALLGLERLFSRPAGDSFAMVPASRAIPLDAAGVDVLVLPPGCTAEPGLLSKLPLGAFELEPLRPDLARDGVLEGRMHWKRAGRPTKLAASTATCVQGPFPLGWAGAHLAKAALMPARALARLDREGEAYWESLPESQPLPPFQPRPADWARLAAKLAEFGLTRAWLDLFHRRQWFLATRPGDGNPERPGFASQPFAPLFPPKGMGWADPIPFTKDGQTWLFIEEIPGQGRGVISVMEVMPQGGFGKARRVLVEPFHLSYPNVFEHEGRVYMVPETAQAGQVRLYRADDFPGGWVLDRVLLDVPGTDATFLEHGGKWWMFVNIRARGGSSWDELHLFMSQGRLGPYRPHPLNPVVSDVRRARPAGPVLRRGGRLFRPGQDSSGWYGRALNVMEIIRLDENGYEERPAARLEPELIPGSFCLHTLVAEGGLEIVDGQRFVPLWR